MEIATDRRPDKKKMVSVGNLPLFPQPSGLLSIESLPCSIKIKMNIYFGDGQHIFFPCSNSKHDE